MRRPGSSTAAGGPVPLSQAIEDALANLQAPASADEPRDGILFAGNPHESVPRALFVDARLTPLERNAWQVFRMLLNDDGVTAFPTYEQLRPYLASMPCSGRASDETVARALILLRLTRWLTLARHRRDPTTGRIQGNLYVLHDEPLTPYESIQLDPRYLELVSHALTHASKSIRRVGQHTLHEISEDPLLSGRVLPSRLHLLATRLSDQGWPAGELASASQDDAPSEDDEPSGLTRNESDASTSRESTCAPMPSSESEAGDRPTSDSEDGAKSLNGGFLRNPKTDRTYVRTDLIKEDVRTVPRTREHASLQLPPAFARLLPEQQAGALAALKQVDMDLQQRVLDEWAARCRAPTVRNPAGYLFGIIQRALRGDFHASASQRASDPAERASTHAAPADAPAQRPVSSEVAQQNIAKLRALLGSVKPDATRTGRKRRGT